MTAVENQPTKKRIQARLAKRLAREERRRRRGEATDRDAGWGWLLILLLVGGWAVGKVVFW